MIHDLTVMALQACILKHQVNFFTNHSANIDQDERQSFR